MSDEQTNPQEAAREALLKGITEGTKTVHKLSSSGQASALKDLAEAYAWVINPDNPH